MKHLIRMLIAAVAACALATAPQAADAVKIGVIYPLTGNAATLISVMLETPRAIGNAKEIAAVPGVDVLLIGTNDLCAEMGIPGDYANERVVDAYDKTVAACRAPGKWAGMGGVYDELLMPRYIEKGVRFVLAGADLSFMLAGAAQRTGFLRKLKAN